MTDVRQILSSNVMRLLHGFYQLDSQFWVDTIFRASMTMSERSETQVQIHQHCMIHFFCFVFRPRRYFICQYDRKIRKQCHASVIPSFTSQLEVHVSFPIGMVEISSMLSFQGVAPQTGKVVLDGLQIDFREHHRSGHPGAQVVLVVSRRQLSFREVRFDGKELFATATIIRKTKSFSSLRKWPALEEYVEASMKLGWTFIQALCSL